MGTYDTRGGTPRHDPAADHESPPECTSCRDGEIDREADWYAVGTIVDDGIRRPFRGYLCDDHLAMLEEDGANLRCQEVLRGQ